VENNKYYDRTYGCWLGKSIGGTLGGPLEGKKEFMELPFRYPEKILANDDLDLQLVWLDILRKKGVKITSDDMAVGWLRNIIYPFDEYGVAIANLKMGLKPPVSGYYNNWFHNSMGAPIRSEIWACIAAGRPEIAGWYAYQDACVDHYDEGIYGEVFLAVLESLAFTETDVNELIKSTLSFIPDSSKVKQVVQTSVDLAGEEKTLKESRDIILEKFGHSNFTDCIQNIGFIILGLLYGKGNFLKTIISAANCGYDTDCTAATAGAVAGILLGKEKILKQSGNDINEKIAAGWGIKDIEIPSDIKQLTGQVMEIKKKLTVEKSLPLLTKPFILPEIPSFSPPLRLPFYISGVFPTRNAEMMEKEVLTGVYDNWKKEIFTGSYFDMNKYFEGSKSQGIFLKTGLKTDKDINVKLFPSCSGGVKMWVDGKLALASQKHNEFLPAPHRPGSPLAEVKLTKGMHDILIEINKRDSRKLEFAWIVADEENHLITDIEYRENEKGL
jgi:ADP-ribosylglycohydrolase